MTTDSNATVGILFRRTMDAEAYAYRLAAEQGLQGVVLDKGALPEELPQLLLADHCVAGLGDQGSPEATPHTRIVIHGSEETLPCHCCQTLPEQAGWNDLLDLIRQLVPHFSATSPPACVPELTRRETDVLRLVGQGLSVRQMADHLQLAESTVGNHKYRLMRKLGVNSSLNLLRLAVCYGLIDL